MFVGVVNFEKKPLLCLLSSQFWKSFYYVYWVVDFENSDQMSLFLKKKLKLW